MNIKTTLQSPEKLKPLFPDPLKLPFGRYFTDYMFTMEYTPENGWHNAEIKPYQPLVLEPSANVFHYSQEVFEGQKSYLSPQGDILLFRPFDNARRLNRSLERMCMPTIPEEDFVAAESAILKLEKRWVPRVKGAALYLRPAVIGTEAALGVRASTKFLFFIILSPVGAYFQEGFNPVALWVSDSYIRAAEGGTGEAKTGGNYAATLLPATQAGKKGYSQVLWLDAREHRYVEEVGAMNIFFVIDGKLVTPALSGSILQGVTRRSVLQLAPDLGLEVEERQIGIDEVTEGIRSGRLTEAFGAGTAAVISPFGRIHYKDTDYKICDVTGPVARKLFDTLTAIQGGELPDKHGWVYKVPE